MEMLANNHPEQIITWSTKKQKNNKKKTGDKGATPLNLQEKKSFPHEVMKIYPEGFLKPVFRELTRLLYVDKRLSLDCGKKHEYSGRTCKPSQMMDSNQDLLVLSLLVPSPFVWVSSLICHPSLH